MHLRGVATPMISANKPYHHHHHIYIYIYIYIYIKTLKPLYNKPLYKKIVHTFGWNSTFSTLKNLLRNLLYKKYKKQLYINRSIVY